jgi:hypothetical protein
LSQRSTWSKAKHGEQQSSEQINPLKTWNCGQAATPEVAEEPQFKSENSAISLAELTFLSIL